MADSPIVHWFPGHMAKATRMITEYIKKVDVVIELLDARIPRSSANPVILELVGQKAKGIRSRSVRTIILGIPNVGKSTLINSLAGSAATRTANKAGHTRGQQWVKIGKNLELLDTPGVLWPKLEDQRAAARLAMTGAISDDVYDLEHVIKQLLNYLLTNTSNILVERYKLKEEEMTDVDTILESIGRRRGCLVSGGIVDFDKARRIILQDYRNTKLGTITLDQVDEEPYYSTDGEESHNG